MLLTPTIQTLDRLVRDLHGESNSEYTTYNIFNQFKALYPFIGGNAAAHSLNLTDPTLNSISWYGSPGHSANGVAFNGASYGNTGINPFSSMSLNSASLGFYSRTEALAYTLDLGARNDASIGFYGSFSYYGSLYTAMNSAETGRGTPAWGNKTSGLLIANRQSATTTKHSVTESFSATYTDNANYLPNLPIYLGAINAGGLPMYYSSKQCAAAFVANGLSDAETVFLHRSIQKYQQSLSRHV